MIIVNLINGRTLACRGGLKLGWWRRILFTLRLPIPMHSFTSADEFLIRPASVSHFGFVTDTEAKARREAADKVEAARQERESRVFQVPGMRNPGGRR